MSLDALTPAELKTLVDYNLKQIGEIGYKSTPIPNSCRSVAELDWEPLRKRIMTAVERIDRIVALGKGSG